MDSSQTADHRREGKNVTTDKIQMKNWSKVGAVMLMGIMAANVVLAGAYFLQKQHFGHLQQYSQAPGSDRMPPVSGIDINAAPWKSADTKCHLVRITEDTCAFCRRDRLNYERLSQAALQSNCEVIEIAPRAGKLGPNARPGVVQMKFVAVDLGPAVYPFVTPQTVVLDRNWAVSYIRRGMFDEKALGDAVEVVRGFAKPADR